MTNGVSSTIYASSLQGMQRAETQLQKAAAGIAQWPNAAPDGDTLDLSAEMVALMTSRDNFMANVEAARTGDEMQRTLLNMVG